MASRRILGQAARALGATQQKRSLNIHEHMSIDLLREYGINVPAGMVAHTVEEAVAAAKALPSDEVVVKAQVLAGGRGKGHFDNGFQGGVHICYDEDEVARKATKMIGANLITKQTDENGRPVEKIFLCERKFPRREYYCSITMDRGLGDANSQFGPVLVASSSGGMNIEEVALANPDAIVKHHIDMSVGITDEKAAEIASRVGFPPAAQGHAATFFQNLYKLFVAKDCTTVEINPMSLDLDGQVYAMDAKVNFDDNAFYKHKDIFELKDWAQEDPREAVAAKADLNYIGLDGTIGCLVNGAGLAMATMDIIQLHGGSPANFLDVGGGATAAQVTEAFKLITSDPRVKAILVNIFGGIMKCDVIAEGIVNAAQTLDMKVPIVVRLQGTNVTEAKAIIASSQMRILSCDNLDDAAKLTTNLANIIDLAQESSINVDFSLP